MTKTLVTGAAGFIGFHVAQSLLKRGETVIGVDNLNSYYNVDLKHARLAQLKEYKNFHFFPIDISDKKAMEEMWSQNTPILNVVNLAAQAGVRYSLTDPFPYITSNVMGFMVVLELCRYQENFKHLVYAITSSVYGSNEEMPFFEHQRTDNPMSLYAATKKSNELMAQSYSHLYKIPISGLRFFTVYGPWGRPDMSAFKFMRAMLAGEPIDIYNNGNMARDYTYIDDIVSGILATLDHPKQTSAKDLHPVYNIGNGHTETLLRFIELIEKSLGIIAKKNFLPMQAGDVRETFADISLAKRELGFSPKVSIEEGVPKLVEWYRQYPNF